MQLSFWQTLKSRTVWTGIAGAALTAFLANNPFQSALSPKSATVVGGVFAVLNAIFRANPKQGAVEPPPVDITPGSSL